MRTENGVLVNLGEIHEIVKEADVFAAGFRLFPERLLIDTRHDDADPDGSCGMPMVAIVDPVATVQERYFWLGQHRPTLGLPQSFLFFFWPHSIAYLEESGLWEAIRERVVGSGFSGALETCDAALRDLGQRERAANVAAIIGEHHQTLWSAPEA
ncbi:MAG: hypothetical protein WEC75_01750 [Dehalococcoidia bacterium]